MTNTKIVMKRLILLFSVITIFSSCSVIKKTHIRDYSERIELVKTNFPEIYELYRRGEVVINDVYTYEKDGHEKVHINYYYR